MTIEGEDCKIVTNKNKKESQSDLARQPQGRFSYMWNRSQILAPVFTIISTHTEHNSDSSILLKLDPMQTTFSWL